MPDASELYKQYTTNEQRLKGVQDFFFSKEKNLVDKVPLVRDTLEYSRRTLNEVEKDVNKLPWFAQAMTPGLINALQYGLDIVLPSSNVEMLLAAAPLIGGASRGVKIGRVGMEELYSKYLPEIISKYYNVEAKMNPAVKAMRKSEWVEEEMGNFFTKFMDPNVKGTKKFLKELEQDGTVDVVEVEAWADDIFVKARQPEAAKAAKEARATTSMQGTIAGKEGDTAVEVSATVEKAAAKNAAPAGQSAAEAEAAQLAKENRRAIIEEQLRPYLESESPATRETFKALRDVVSERPLPSPGQRAKIRNTIGQEIKGIGATAKELGVSPSTVSKRVKAGLEGQNLTRGELGKARTLIHKYPSRSIAKAVNEVIPYAPDYGKHRKAVARYLAKPMKGQPNAATDIVDKKEALKEVDKILDFLSKRN